MKISTIVKTLAIASFIVMSIPLQASALSWQWSLTGIRSNNGEIDTASGTFTTDGTQYDATGQTQYTVTDITGIFDNYAITGLNPISSNNDNLIKWNGTNILVDFNGLSFTTDDPLGSVTLYYGTNNGNFGITDSYIIGAIKNTTLQPVPFEIPGGATISALGSVLALGVIRKARKTSKPVQLIL